MVLIKSKSKITTKQKQRQSVVVNINTEPTKRKRRPRQAPKKPREGKNDNIQNPLYYPSIIHAVQQPPQNMMQPQEIKDAIREAVRNISHAARKDQYIEQLQHSNDLERQREAKTEEHAEAKVEHETLRAEALPLQTVTELNVPDLHQEAPIPIVAEQAPRERTPIEKPIENENKIIQYVGREREQENISRPYLRPVNLRDYGVFSSPFEGVGHPLNSPFVKLEKKAVVEKTLRDKMLEAAEERLRYQNQQITVISQPPPPPPQAQEPEPQARQRQLRRTPTQHLADYPTSEIKRILTDYEVFDTADAASQKQTLIYKYANSLVGKRVRWNNYTKIPK